MNFVINSDFKWALLGMALLWMCSLVLLWLEKISNEPDKRWVVMFARCLEQRR